MRISEITYKTNPSEFINIKEVEGIIEQLETVLQNFDNQIVAPLTNSLTRENSGLDSESFNIDGEALLNTKAKECKDSFDNLLTSGNTLKNKILDSAMSHKESELERYIQCLEERIETVEEKIREISSQITNTDGNLVRLSTLQAQKKEYELELNGALGIGLKSKLSLAKAELGSLS